MCEKVFKIYTFVTFNQQSILGDLFIYLFIFVQSVSDKLANL